VDAIILYHEEVSDDNKHHRSSTNGSKFLRDKGKDRGSVEIPFDACAKRTLLILRPERLRLMETITPFTGKAFAAHS